MPVASLVITVLSRWCSHVIGAIPRARSLKHNPIPSDPERQLSLTVLTQLRPTYSLRTSSLPLASVNILGRPGKPQCPSLGRPRHDGRHPEPAEPPRPAVLAGGAEEDVEGEQLDGHLRLSLHREVDVLGDAGGLVAGLVFMSCVEWTDGDCRKGKGNTPACR